MNSPQSPRSPQIQVAPIHFEDFSGEQFERLAFAFVLRDPELHSVEWIGQSGGDDGKDILAKDAAGDEHLFQCADFARLTFTKVKKDIAKIIPSRPANLRCFTVIAGGKVSAELRQKIRKEVLAKLNLDDCTVWSGREFEERLRYHAPVLLRRFVEGVSFPEQAAALRTLTTSSSNPPDQEIVTALMRSFDRPAFRTPFQLESSLPRFKKAIAETVNTLNTGHLPSGGSLPSRHTIRDASIKAAVAQLVNDVVALRTTFDRLLKSGDIKPCSCTDPDCPVFMFSAPAIQAMDGKRSSILVAARQLCPEVSTEFYALR
jgi:hypothetical protein